MSHVDCFPVIMKFIMYFGLSWRTNFWYDYSLFWCDMWIVCLRLWNSSCILFSVREQIFVSVSPAMSVSSFKLEEESPLFCVSEEDLIWHWAVKWKWMHSSWRTKMYHCLCCHGFQWSPKIGYEQGKWKKEKELEECLGLNSVGYWHDVACWNPSWQLADHYPNFRCHENCKFWIQIM
jgi:hypothetical protein